MFVVWTVVGSVQAQTAYVTDTLQLGVYQAADTSDLAFVYLKTADAVEILERTTYYARVRIPDGREGWVRTSFLVEERPASLRLASVEQEREEAAVEIKALKEKIDRRESRIRDLEKQILSNEAGAESETDELDALEAVNEALNQRLDSYRFRVSPAWFLVGAGLSLVIGFFAGLWWDDRRSRARHGGHRIY